MFITIHYLLLSSQQPQARPTDTVIPFYRLGSRFIEVWWHVSCPQQWVAEPGLGPSSPLPPQILLLSLLVHQDSYLLGRRARVWTTSSSCGSPSLLFNVSPCNPPLPWPCLCHSPHRLHSHQPASLLFLCLEWAFPYRCCFFLPHLLKSVLHSHVNLSVRASLTIPYKIAAPDNSPSLFT